MGKESVKQAGENKTNQVRNKIHKPAVPGGGPHLQTLGCKRQYQDISSHGLIPSATEAKKAQEGQNKKTADMSKIEDLAQMSLL